MEIINLVFIIIITRIIFHGLFDRDWHRKWQANFDSIRNKNNFWFLMSQEINAEKVFSGYVNARNQNGYISVGDCVMHGVEFDKDDLDVHIIKKDDWFKITNSVFNPKIIEREKIIYDLLEKSKITFTEDEIRKSFKKYFDEHFWYVDDVQEYYGHFMSARLHSLVGSDKTGPGIWAVLKNFVDNSSEIDDSAEKRGALCFYSVKMLQNKISDFVIDLLSEKIENKEQWRELRRALKEWQQLQLLRWCIIDFSSWEIGTNSIQRGMWRLANFLFL